MKKFASLFSAALTILVVLLFSVSAEAAPAENANMNAFDNFGASIKLKHSAWYGWDAFGHYYYSYGNGVVGSNVDSRQDLDKSTMTWMTSDFMFTGHVVNGYFWKGTMVSHSTVHGYGYPQPLIYNSTSTVKNGVWEQKTFTQRGEGNLIQKMKDLLAVQEGQFTKG